VAYNRRKEMNKEENILLEEISKQKKQIEFLQKQCRKAGKAILDQEVQIGGLKKDLDRVSEERDNFLTMLGDGKK
jgi:beta-lactamase class A|tara:strand:+ start:16 stop:240 length:225 start_codon:yes stop_codon:yes gene_type:complete